MGALCALAFSISCSSARVIWLTKKHHIIDTTTGEALYPAGIHSPRYIIFTGGSSPYAEINNMAADLILEGKFPQAEVLLSDLSKDEPKRGDAFNNLAIVYESSGNYDKACDNFLRACMIDPDNKYFRMNFNGAGALRDEK
jgi:hypothetical protein